MFRSFGRVLRRALHTPNPPAFKLRDYQATAVNNVLKSIAAGVRRPAVVLATGGGKTVVMSHLLPQIKAADTTRRKTLILAHKEELVRQAAKTVREINPDLEVQIDMRRQIPGPEADVIVGSVPTLVRLSRLNRYDPAEFKTIILDECHHATASSWIKILNHFGALSNESDIVVVGFTATMERADGTSLGNVFQEIAYERNLLTMIRSKELCDVSFSTMKVDLSLDGVGTRFGDYDTSELAAVMNQGQINLQVAKAYLQLKKELGLKSTLVFCVDINHCRTLCGVLQANGINAQYVTGETARHERRDILDDFKNGKIDVLCNVLVFTEGTDIPNIDSMILARPTKSRPLLTQMIGRGLRLHHGKDCCHVIDMVGTLKIGVSSVPTLFGLPENHNVNRKTFEELEEEKLQLDVEKERREAIERQLEVQETLERQKQIEQLSLQFDVINGFAAMMDRKLEVREDTADTNAAFRDSYINWVRLEYNVWGTEVSLGGSFLTVERSEDEQGQLVYTLYKNDKASRKMIIASNFSCPRTLRSKLNTGSVEYLINIASNIVRRKHKAGADKLITQKQAGYLYGGLSRKVTSQYGEHRLGEFRDKISELNMSRASAMIFALKYSVNSLWIKWELKNLLGLTPKAQAQLDKKIQKLKSGPKLAPRRPTSRATTVSS